MLGNLFIVAAPSGAGKTTLVRLLLENDPSIRVSISHTTRAPRNSECDGVDYHFVSEPSFLDKIGKADFIEWAQVHGNYYGTSRSGIESVLETGQDLLLEIDWQGARQIRKLFPQAIGIFILPPSQEELERRLRARATDDETTITRRIAAAREEMRHVSEFDYVIINNQLQRALRELLAVVYASRLLFSVQKHRHSNLFASIT